MRLVSSVLRPQDSGPSRRYPPLEDLKAALLNLHWYPILKLSKVATFSFVQRQVWHLRGRRPCVDNSLLHKVGLDHACYNASHSTHSYRGKCSHSQYSYAFRYRQRLLPFPLWLHYSLPFQRQRWIVRVRDGSVFALDHRRSSRFSENNSNRIAPATDGVTDTRSRKLCFMLWNWGSTRRRGSGFITDSTRFGRLCCLDWFCFTKYIRNTSPYRAYIFTQTTHVPHGLFGATRTVLVPMYDRSAVSMTVWVWYCETEVNTGVDVTRWWWEPTKNLKLYLARNRSVDLIVR